ncbi:hypothetical protein SVAN01_02270 [Stagonosporopsis vannaccii]|nr:hypothetical protein SVAN01_02270 [Stagonosporopsis vannaccii]
MRFTPFLLTFFATALVAASPCPSSSSSTPPTPEPTEVIERCTRICAAEPIEDCGGGNWVRGQRQDKIKVR